MTIPMVTERLLPELVTMAEARGMAVELEVLRASAVSLNNVGKFFDSDEEWDIDLHVKPDTYTSIASAVESAKNRILTLVRELFRDKPPGYIGSVRISCSSLTKVVPSMPANTITEPTRRNLFDEFALAGVAYWGRLSEVDFLSRVFQLQKMPYTDRRVSSAAGEIFQHRVAFNDWTDDWWVVYDSRFNLIHCSDVTLLRFLCEMIHPVVRPDAEDVAKLLKISNRHLKPDGWEIYESSAISGRPLFSARKLLVGRHIVGHAVDTARKITVVAGDYISQQITRMNAAADGDPELAIGSAKEFVETICKSILDERGITRDEGWDLPKLVKTTMEELKLVAEGVTDRTKAADTIKALLGNLSQVTHRLAELRNPYGTGHGKVATTKGLSPRHARLAIGSAVTLGTFLYETHQETLKK